MPLSARGALGLALLLLSGCVKEKVSEPPLLSVPAAQACTAAPDLARAVSARAGAPEKKDAPLIVRVDAGSPCIDKGQDGKSLYAVVDLAGVSADQIISVASEPLGQSIFAPRLLLLDTEGRTRREMGGDSFMFRGGMLTALIRAHADERYLLVESDSGRVGKNEFQISGDVRSQMIGTGTAFFSSIPDRRRRAPLPIRMAGRCRSPSGTRRRNRR